MLNEYRSGLLYRFLIEHNILCYDRGMVNFCNEHFKNKSLVGVEIGVRDAKNARKMLELLNISCLYLIDPYCSYFNGDVEVTVEHQQRHFEKASRLLSQYNDVVEWLIKTSSDAVSIVPDNVDFIYIDGNHDYDFIKEDIALYYPKVRIGGVIGGHDWDGMGVVRAVVEYFGFDVVNVRGKDWWVVKN